MHFRVRGNSVQVVKSVTNPATGKPTPQPLGSANLLTGELGEKLAAVLTEAEKAELTAWLARRKETVAKRNELEFLVLADRMRDVAEWIRKAPPATVKPQLEELTSALRELRIVLNKAQSAV